MIVTVVICCAGLASCGSAQEAARERAALACFSAGIDERSPKRDECMRTVGAVALQDQRRRADDQIAAGIATMARDFGARQTETLRIVALAPHPVSSA